MNYYDWYENELICSECNWAGTGSEASVGEGFIDGAEYHCPKCDHYFGFVANPLVEESLTDLRATKSDRIVAEILLNASNNKSDDKDS